MRKLFNLLVVFILLLSTSFIITNMVETPLFKSKTYSSSEEEYVYKVGMTLTDYQKTVFGLQSSDGISAKDASALIQKFGTQIQHQVDSIANLQKSDSTKR